MAQWTSAHEPVGGRWDAVATADGINLVAVGGGQVASSTNGGESWEVYQVGQDWESVSASGGQLFAVKN